MGAAGAGLRAGLVPEMGGLVPEMAHAGEYHCQPRFVCRRNHLVIADRPAGLNNGRGTGIGGTQQPVGERKNASDATTEPRTSGAESPAASAASSDLRAAMRELSSLLI